MNVMQRGNQWCLRKRVPARFKPVEARAEVWISLQTDSKWAALEKAPAVWNAQLSAWEDTIGKRLPIVLQFDSPFGERFGAAAQFRRKAHRQLICRHMPNANSFMLHIMAAVAKQEARASSDLSITVVFGALNLSAIGQWLSCFKNP